MPTPELDNAPKWGTFTGLLIPRAAVRTRLGRVKKLATARLRINKSNNQSMLVDHWPTLRPLSLPITTQIRAYTPPLPGSLHIFGWKPDPNYKIRHDPPVRVEYPFDYSPPGNLAPPSAEQASAPTGPFTSPYGNFSPGSPASDGNPKSRPMTPAAAPEVHAHSPEHLHPQRALPTE
jgi:hypothetical protein